MRSLEIARGIVVVIVPLSGLTLAIVSAIWASRQWRYQHITKEWGSLVQFLLNYTPYMNPEKNANYATVYEGDEKRKYEMIARLCLSYLDDVYYLGLWNFSNDWLCGSVNFLAGTHRKWLEDHRNNYADEFYESLITALNKING